MDLNDVVCTTLDADALENIGILAEYHHYVIGGKGTVKQIDAKGRKEPLYGVLFENDPMNECFWFTRYQLRPYNVS